MGEQQAEAPAQNEEVQEIDLFDDGSSKDRLKEVSDLAEELRLQAERNKDEAAIKFLKQLAEDLKIQQDNKN